MPAKQFTSVVIDTVNQLQIDEFINLSKKPNYDD